jgi:hypothetical protein
VVHVHGVEHAGGRHVRRCVDHGRLVDGHGEVALRAQRWRAVCTRAAASERTAAVGRRPDLDDATGPGRGPTPGHQPPGTNPQAR